MESDVFVPRQLIQTAFVKGLRILLSIKKYAKILFYGFIFISSLQLSQTAIFMSSYVLFYFRNLPKLRFLGVET
jgi:hypothetical protein